MRKPSRYGALLVLLAIVSAAAHGQPSSNPILFDPATARKLLPPPAPQKSSPTVPVDVDTSKIANEDIFSHDAQMSRRFNALDRQLDALTQENRVLREQLAQAAADLSEMQKMTESHVRASTFGANGMSLINMVQDLHTRNRKVVEEQQHCLIPR